MSSKTENKQISKGTTYRYLKIPPLSIMAKKIASTIYTNKYSSSTPLGASSDIPIKIKEDTYNYILLPKATDATPSYSDGFAYSITQKLKNKNQIVAYLLGSSHEDFENRVLNPKIKEILPKIEKIYFESNQEIERTLVDWDQKYDFSTTIKNWKRDYINYYNNNTCNDDTQEELYKNLLDEAHEVKLNTLPMSRYTGTEKLILRAKNFTWENVRPLQCAITRKKANVLCSLSSSILNEKIQKNTAFAKKWTHASAVAHFAFQTGNESLATTFFEWNTLEDPAYGQFILRERNEEMAITATKAIRNAAGGSGLDELGESRPVEPCLIALGCSHLFGRHGVLKLLEKSLGEAYSIEKL